MISSASSPLLNSWCGTSGGTISVVSGPKSCSVPSSSSRPRPACTTITSSQSCRCGGLASPGAIVCFHTEKRCRPFMLPASVT